MHLTCQSHVMRTLFDQSACSIHMCVRFPEDLFGVLRMQVAQLLLSQADFAQKEHWSNVTLGASPKAGTVTGSVATGRVTLVTQKLLCRWYLLYKDSIYRKRKTSKEKWGPMKLQIMTFWSHAKNPNSKGCKQPHKWEKCSQNNLSTLWTIEMNREKTVLSLRCQSRVAKHFFSRFLFRLNS